MRLKNIASQFVLLGFALIVSNPVVAESGWVASAKITKVVVTTGGGVNFRITPELSGCTSQSGYGNRYASVYPNHPGLDKIYSAVLTAYTTDKPIGIYFTDSTCKVGEVELGGR